MLRRDLLQVLMATPLSGWLRPWLPPMVDEAAAESPNAASVYRRAFDWARGLEEEDSKLLREAATIKLDDPRIGALIELAQPALEAIREAATIKNWRWKSETGTIDDVITGHLDIANHKILHAAFLSARWHARAGRGHEALDNLFAALTMSHRIGTGGVMVARFLESAGELTALGTLGRILPELDRAALDDLSRRLEILPHPEPASATIEPDSRHSLFLLRTEIKQGGPTIKGPQWQRLGFSPDQGAALERLTGGDRDRLLDHIEATRPAFTELARRLELPRSECRASLDAFVEAERTTHPIVVSSVGLGWAVRYTVDRMLAMRAMLQAGISLVRDGEAAFQAHRDPFGTGPFGLEPRGKGFLIRSALRNGDRPEASLQIGGAE